MFFSCWRTFETSISGLVFFRKSLFMHLGATSTGETVCKEEKVWDIQKAEGL